MFPRAFVLGLAGSCTTRTLLWPTCVVLQSQTIHAFGLFTYPGMG